MDADPTGELFTAYIIQKELRDLLALAETGGHHLTGSGPTCAAYSVRCEDSDIPEATQVAHTIE